MGIFFFLSLDLYIDVEKLWMGGGGCTLYYSISSGPLLSFEIEIGDGPGPALHKKKQSQVQF